MFRGVGSSLSRMFVRQSHKDVQLSPAFRDKYYPKLGNRDIVGYGFNGNPVYLDRPEFPAPAIRFRENSEEVLKLRQKENGDWKTLSLADKKALYRASFCQTYSEMNAQSGDWKLVLGMVLGGIAVTGWLAMYLKHIVLPPRAHTITREWQEKQLENMVKQRQGAVEGAASKWDYENNRWK